MALTKFCDRTVSIPVMAIGYLLTTNRSSSMLLNSVSGKVLTHQYERISH
jgi:hypothetical protein